MTVKMIVTTWDVTRPGWEGEFCIDKVTSDCDGEDDSYHFGCNQAGLGVRILYRQGHCRL